MMLQKISQPLVSAIDAYNYLAQYRMLVSLMEEKFGSLDEHDLEQAKFLFQLYSSKTEEILETLGENLKCCQLELMLAGNQGLLNRAAKHLPQFKAQYPDAVAITVHDADENKGFLYLDVYAPIPERLNQRREILIGKPVTFLPAAISSPREHYIKRSLANGQIEYSYQYRDDFLWQFNVTVVPCGEEIVTIVKDAKSWQIGYWLNRI